MNKETLIERYFEKDLSAEEKALFDKLLLKDPLFAEDVVFQKRLKKVITLDSRQNFKEQLQKLEAQRKPRTESKKIWLYIAAGILLLLGIGNFFLFNQSGNERLFEQYFEPYPNTVAPVVRQINESDLQSDAFAAYEEGDFEEAANLFEKLARSTGKDYAFFYAAHSNMILKKFDKAEQIFKNHVFTENFRDERDWYLALIYIRLNKKEQAEELLEMISKENSFNSEKAKILQQKLKP